jgi:hypothetical protein
MKFDEAIRVNLRMEEVIMIRQRPCKKVNKDAKQAKMEPSFG